VLRDGQQVTEKVTLGSNPKVGTQGFLGIGAVERPVAPFTTTISLERIGGPSAGLVADSAGNLYGVSGYIGAAGFIMLFNSTTVPSNGSVTPVAWAYVPAAGSWSMDWGNTPQYFSTGISVEA